jgi:hypothetical protein
VGLIDGPLQFKQTKGQINPEQSAGRAARNSRWLAHYPIHGAEMCAKSLRALLVFLIRLLGLGAHLLFLRSLRPIKAEKVTSLACITFEHQPTRLLPFYYFVCDRGRRAPGQLPNQPHYAEECLLNASLSLRHAPIDGRVGGCAKSPNM